MYLEQLTFQGVRNLTPAKLLLSPNLNIFEGVNGAGKSSLLEALSLVTSGRSFRTNKLSLVVNDSQDSFSINAKYQNSSAHSVGMSHLKTQKINRIKVDKSIVKNLSKLSSIYPTQVLCPESYHLIDSGPLERRKYLDWLLFHVEHSFISQWKQFTKIIKQRNALLKNAQNINQISHDIKAWDEQLVPINEAINHSRHEISKQLTIVFNQLTKQLGLDFCSNVTLNYYSGYKGDYQSKLIDNLTNDFKRGFTQFGAHKSDIRIKIGNQLAKDILSRGQKKVLINTLFLAQTLLLKQKNDKDSLFIIDDFTSELDVENQKTLLNVLMQQKNTQIVLSCLQLDALKWLKKGYNNAYMFHVEHGNVSRINNDK